MIKLAKDLLCSDVLFSDVRKRLSVGQEYWIALPFSFWILTTMVHDKMMYKKTQAFYTNRIIFKQNIY